MSFAARPASTAWEQIPLPGSAAGFFWAWYKPPAAPECLVIRLPDATFHAVPDRPSMTARAILHAAFVDPHQVSGWTLYGTPLEAQDFAAVLDRPIPPPPAGSDPELCVYFAAFQSPALFDAMTAAPVGRDVGHIFDMIDTDWNLSLLLEKHLVLLRKQLSGMLTRITAIDRDLNPDERMYGDRQAKNDWQEARRWLKDSAAKLTRYIKEHDTGETSNAGKREWFVKTYQELVVPRRPFDDLVQVQRNFESHRKRLQILQTNMTTALQFATSDGERRAQQVLERISRSVRDARAKRRGRNDDNAKLKRRHLDP
ncbi:MAG TPA: hypothetical protein VGP63_13285 [Planctomycetaceae bacterium]|jgi:hypothetical protein|nr:hypothetical protein [Planctomycetaceae bacterium]